MTDWLILRTSPVHTMALADALNYAGLEAWTPVETVKVEPKQPEPWEKPRARRRVASIVTRPMLATFVFADASRLVDLARLSHSPASTYQVWDDAAQRMVRKVRPFFTLFDAGARPIPDRALSPIRTIAGRRRKPRGEMVAIKAGDPVRLTEGAYEGLRGEVLSVSGKKAKVRFPGSHFAFDIQIWLLKPDLDLAPQINQKGVQAERAGKAA